jgi:hypothetical protein
MCLKGDWRNGLPVLLLLRPHMSERTLTVPGGSGYRREAEYVSVTSWCRGVSAPPP